MTNDNSITVIGAGIGGLTLANALRRRGLRAKVFERAPALAEVGAGVWVPSNAMQIMERLGLDAAIRDHSVSLTAIEVGTDEGELLHHMDLDEFKKRYGHTTQSIHRARLQEILAEAWGQEQIQFNKECVGISQDDDQVIATFADGSQEASSLLIGADGIRSCVREHLFPGIELRDSGQTCFRGISDMAMSEELHTICRETWGVQQRFGCSAINREQVYWFAPIDQPFDVAPEDVKPRLLELYKSFPTPIPEILACTLEAAIIRTDLFDFAPISSWSKGRCVLMGDAAHATTPNLGQGAAQAIESGYILARALSTHQSHHEAFAQYQEIRMAKAHDITNTSWRYGKTSHMQDGLLRSLRDFAVRHTPDFVADKQAHKIYRLDY